MNPQFSSDTVFAIATRFESLFGQPTDLWVECGGTWTHVVNDRVARERAPLGGATQVDSPPIDGNLLRETLIQEQPDGAIRIGTTLSVAAPGHPSHCETGLAWGLVKTNLRAIVGGLARLANENSRLERENAELRQDLTPHLEQISYDFEQLTWLRRLGTQVEGIDASYPLADLARQIVPDLCDLVHAENLAFVQSDATSISTDATGQPVSTSIVWAQGPLVDERRCRDWILQLSADNPERVVVWNQDNTGFSKPLTPFPEIRSCVLVPIAHRGVCYGWLIGFNRIPWRMRSPYAANLAPTEYRDDAFGTGDAGLMASAAGTLAACARNAELFREKELLLIGVIRSLINTIDAKDAYTCGHSDRVALMAKCLGRKLGLSASRCEQLFMAGLLHDIGKIGVPDEILKKPGKLTEEEFAAIRQHPTIGHEILKHLPQIHFVLPGVRHHHEMVNGKGYPDGLMGDDIPLFGRILAVADSFDAMTSARPYRTPMPSERAESILAGGAGTQWDAEIVDVFIQSRSEIEDICQSAEQHLESLLRPVEVATHWHDAEESALEHAVSASHA